mgnify:CR=1 FL=1
MRTWGRVTDANGNKKWVAVESDDAHSDVKAGIGGVAVLRELRYSCTAVHRAADLPRLLCEHGSATVCWVFCITGNFKGRWSR